LRKIIYIIYRYITYFARKIRIKLQIDHYECNYCFALTLINLYFHLIWRLVNYYTTFLKPVDFDFFLISLFINTTIILSSLYLWIFDNLFIYDATCPLKDYADVSARYTGSIRNVILSRFVWTHLSTMLPHCLPEWSCWNREAVEAVLLRTPGTCPQKLNWHGPPRWTWSANESKGTICISHITQVFCCCVNLVIMDDDLISIKLLAYAVSYNTTAVYELCPHGVHWRTLWHNVKLKPKYFLFGRLEPWRFMSQSATKTFLT